jgi:ABC-type sugar transport system substrate-binding protein
MLDNPPANKEVAVVTQPPGEFVSTDNRVKGFEETVEAAGYDVVATGITNLELDKTRTQVTNILTAHPDISAIYSANGPMGQGTTEALKGDDQVMQLTLDFIPEDVTKLLDGTVSAIGNQHPEEEGRLAVETMADVIQGKKVAEEINTKATVVEKANAKEEATKLSL